MAKKIYITFLFLIGCGFNLSAQSSSSLIPNEVGQGMIQNFGPQDYSANDQNFNIVQGSDGLIYVANRGGVLAYNGHSWEKLLDRRLRSLGIGEENQIFVGLFDDFGILKKDSVNQFSFSSLLNHIPEANRDFQSIDQVIVGSNSVFFCSPQYLFQWIPLNGISDKSSEGTMNIYASEQIFDPFHLLNDTLYVRKRGLGLMRFTGNDFELIPGGETLSGSGVRAILPFDQSDSEIRFIIATIRHGFFSFNGESVVPYSMGVHTREILNKNLVYSGKSLRNGDWLFSLMPGNIIITDSKGRLKNVLNKAYGLRDEFSLDFCEDNQQGLWLALNDGIARVNSLTNFSRFGEESGLGRSVTDIKRYKGKLFFTCQSGVYQLSDENHLTEPPKISLFHNQFQSNTLLKLEDKLLAGGSSGLAEIDGGKVNEITDLGVAELYRSPFNPNIIFHINNEGLRLYIFANERWQLTGWVKGISTGYLAIMEESPGRFWLGSNNDLALLELDIEEVLRTKGLPEIIPKKVTFFGEKEGIQSFWNAAFNIEGKTVFATGYGLKRFDSVNQVFIPDTSFGEYLADSLNAIYRIFQYEPGTFWVISDRGYQDLKQNLEKITRNNDGSYTSEFLTYKPILDLGEIQIIYQDENDPDITWFGGIEGVIRYNSKVESKINQEILPVIRRVYIRDSLVLYGGGYIDSQNDDFQIRQAYSTSSIRFEYALPFFANPENTLFQYKLENFEDKWSAWTNKTEKEYGNLPEGAYRFVIRSKNSYGIISQEMGMDLKILPPWYRTWWAFTLFGILTFFLITTIVYAYNRLKTQQLEARNKKLEETVEKRTEEIKTKNTQLAESLDNLQKTQQQLIVQEKMASLGQLTVGIAHEIKNPLNFINNFAKSSVEMTEELKEEIETKMVNLSQEDRETIFELMEDIQEQMSIVNEHGVRADEIVKGMMDHANDNKGEKRNTDINKLIKDQVNLALVGYHSKTEKVNIDIKKSLSPNLPQIMVNPQEIGRVLINLFNNAFFAMEQKALSEDHSYRPLLEIASKLIDKNIHIVIRDNGTGIPQAIINQVFQPFFTTKTTEQGNVGLGLSISYDIITKGHQGNLQVRSEEGKFSEFTMKLPVE